MCELGGALKPESPSRLRNVPERGNTHVDNWWAAQKTVANSLRTAGCVCPLKRVRVCTKNAERLHVADVTCESE